MYVLDKATTALTLALLVLPVAAFARTSAADLAQTGNAGGALPCASCHGANGEGQVSDAGPIPRLAGLSAPYLVKQLEDYKRGQRLNDIMQLIAQALEPGEITDVAAYYADRQAPASPPPATPSDVLKQGEQLALLGKWEANLPPCLSCHGPNGVGVAPSFPYLAGQFAGYIEGQFRQWRSGERKNDPLDLMKTVARGLDERETAAVASYFQTLAPPRQQGVP
jgi:cytochrome c553